MASKKYTLALALSGLLASASYAQTMNDAGDSYITDSSKVSVKNTPQFNEFKNNAYPYPAQPRDMWELGGGIGNGILVGNHGIFAKNSLGHSNTGGFEGTLSLRKSLSNLFSLRAYYAGTIGSTPSTSYLGYPAAKEDIHSAGIDAIASLNAASHYRGNPKSNIYVFAGYGLAASFVRTYRVDGYHTFYSPANGLITTFGGTANTFFSTAPGRKDWSLMHVLSGGTGISFKVSPKFNLGIEERVSAPMFGYKYLDGTSTSDKNVVLAMTNFRLNMNIGNAATHVEPLWWINPNNYIYDEVNAPKHMKMPPVVLPDADGDGVTDQFDLEPNTPKGAAVDTHGRALDTDGDGVPDYRDKEKLTPQNCFPVNADGVGTCPEPACCTELRNKIAQMTVTPPVTCAISSLPSVTFKSGSARLSKDAMAVLTSAASQLNANPNCHVKVIGYGAASKQQQQLSWDRVNAVIRFLVEKQGISEGRVIFTYGEQGDNNTVDLQPTTETGPNTVPAPHPEFKTSK